MKQGDTNIKENGFTLIELLVAMGLFVLVVSITSASFVKAVRNEKLIVSLMAANQSVSLTLEQIAREVRTGYNFNQISGTEFQFVTSDNFSVWYRLNNGGIERGSQNQTGGVDYIRITADNVKVTAFNIVIMGNNSGDGYPPRVTIGMSVTSADADAQKLGIFTNIQTTVSARIIDT